MPKPITHVQPPLEFISPAFSPVARTVGRSLLPWLRWREGIVQVQVDHAERLADLFHQFQTGKTRFLLAFRHPSTNDPLCLADLVWEWVPRSARQHGIELTAPTHAHFIYDRGIPLWAGKSVGWISSRLGGTPIRRGKVDLVGLRSARHLFAHGQFPMAAAPEGATNGHSGIVSPLEPGIAQFGFWCVEDLLKADRPEQVVIVPVGVQYFFIDAPWKSLVQLLRQLEVASGIVSPESSDGLGVEGWQNGMSPTPEQEAVLYRRLFQLGEHLLARMEQFYATFYKQAFPDVPAADPAVVEALYAGQLPLKMNEHLANRLKSVLAAALTVAEQTFDLPPKGSLTDRCRRLEQAAWDRIYREDLQRIEALCGVDRGLADRVAEEADLCLWHMRLVETFVSVTGHYVIEKPSVERFAEMVLLLWDLVSRIKGKSPFPRPKLGKQRAQLIVGQPLSVSDRWQAYKTNRRQAVTNLTHDLQSALEALVKDEGSGEVGE